MRPGTLTPGLTTGMHIFIFWNSIRQQVFDSTGYSTGTTPTSFVSITLLKGNIQDASFYVTFVTKKPALRIYFCCIKITK